MDFVERLKSSVDIVRVVGEYVRLKRIGSGPRYVGLCPFHTEKTPSFSVHQAHQFYKCFGCGAGGDVIKFVMEIERLSFYEALKLLAERYGIPMPQRPLEADPESRLRAALHHIHEVAARFFQSALASAAGSAARAYLESRGLTPALWEQFGLGWAPPSGQELVRVLRSEGFSEEQMEASGLILRRTDSPGHFDRFRHRLMFPIHSESGKVIAFAGRALAPGDEPKYMNSPETPIYRKSYVLYNLNRAREFIRRAGYAILVEGYMDVIGLWKGGVHEVVASCGTALTNWQVRSLVRHADNVVVNFDPDEAGAGATERSIQTLLEEGARIRVVELEAGLDPDEYVRQFGSAAYRARVEAAPRYFNWLAERARRRFNTETAQGRVEALQFLLPAIQRVSDKLERATIAGELAAQLGVKPGLVLDYFKRAATERRTAAFRPPSPSVKPVERILLNVVLRNPEARSEVLGAVRSLPELREFATRNIFEKILALWTHKPDFDLADLDARLEEADRNLVSSLVLADELSEADYTVEQARECLRRLASQRIENLRAQLRSQIREAEKAGNYELVVQLTGELARLGREATE